MGTARGADGVASDRSVADRLQLKHDRRLALVDAPVAVAAAIGAAGRRCGIEAAEVVLAFAIDRAALDGAIARTLRDARPDAILWVAYPKLSSRLAGDLHRDIVRRAASERGLATVAQIAIDDDWSALRLKRAG